MQTSKKFVNGKSNEKQKSTDDLRINEKITLPFVRLIDEKGVQAGIFSRHDAITRAKTIGLDLVEISSSGNPPVCKLMDYGKFKYRQKRKVMKSKKKQILLNMKEVKFRPKTEKHDLEFKIKNVKKFLQQKKRVKVSIIFKGREIIYTEIGKQMLENILIELKEYATVDSPPKMEGKQLVILLIPTV